MPHAQTTFAMQTWKEETYEETPNQSKLTRVTASYSYTGTIDGNSHVEYLMMYRSDNTGNFVGLERLEGQIAGKSGSFVLQHTGTFDPVGVTSQWFIIKESGTGELTGLTGQGEYAISGHGPYDIAFDYEL